MKKNRCYLLRMGIVLFMALSIIIPFSCKYYEYGKGIIEETKTTFEKNKAFIYSLSIEGEIEKKSYCEQCDLNRYTLLLKLKKISEKPNISSTQFSPYYSFESDSLLRIAVSKKIYELVNEKDKVYKEKKSFNIRVDNKEYLLLSKTKNKWMP